MDVVPAAREPCVPSIFADEDAPAEAALSSTQSLQLALQPSQPGGKWKASPDKALRVAADKGDLQGLQDALSCGGGAGVDGDGKAAVHYAARSGQVEAMRILLQAGLDPNSPDLRGGLPVDEAEYWAVRAESEEQRNACLATRNILVQFGGNRSDPSQRQDSESFLNRRYRLEEKAMRDRNERHFPWHDNLGEMGRPSLCPPSAADQLLSLPDQERLPPPPMASSPMPAHQNLPPPPMLSSQVPAHQNVQRVRWNRPASFEEFCKRSYEAAAGRIPDDRPTHAQLGLVPLPMWLPEGAEVYEV
eukprot:TRINITY_DN47541_c0_g1_i1.p1 TRINITY_DN47541_c0_g1~~TRINITY_DN47541_c0_g1_i1.p1  ORF type:complete len:311 (-),score=60.88 TRINITY_DN47541_c0_g1_i1:96-1004(-)